MQRCFFYVDSADELASKIGDFVHVLAEEEYYKYINKEGLKLIKKSVCVYRILGIWSK